MDGELKQIWDEDSHETNEQEFDSQGINGLLYIAGPYRAKTVNGVRRNIRKAEMVMEWAWVNGWIPVCPHLNSAFVDGLVPDEMILKRYLRLLTRCDAILMMKGWQDSEGAKDEYMLARNYIGIRVLDDPLEE